MMRVVCWVLGHTPERRVRFLVETYDDPGGIESYVACGRCNKEIA